MIHRLFTFSLVILLLLPPLAKACDSAQPCVEKGQWDLGVALGVGVRTNPLNGGDNLPNIIQLDIAWYGEQFYFDNGEAGFRLLQTNRFGLESYLTIDREKAYFTLWHTGNITLANVVSPPGGSVVPPTTDNPNPPQLSIDQISSRKWAVNGGIRGHYYGANFEWSLAMETDVSSVHNGHKLTLSYNHFWQGDNWQFSVRPSVIYKSDDLINYYYGVGNQDTSNSALHYRADGGIQPGLSVLYTRKINQHWYWLANGSYRHLHDDMTDSPIVAKDNIINLFFGAGYRF